MLGHSSLQMIFQRYYSWIPQKTRSDGQAFRNLIARDKLADDLVKAKAKENPDDTDKRWSKIVPLADYRQKKGAA
jgi:integrase